MTDLPLYARNPRPAFHDQEAVDRLIAIVIALTSELSVMRDRVATLERLGEAAGWLAPGGVDGHVPDADERARREGDREALLARVFAIMQADIATPSAEPGAFWQTVAEIEERRA